VGNCQSSQAIPCNFSPFPTVRRLVFRRTVYVYPIIPLVKKNISAVNMRQLLRLLSGAWNLNIILQTLLTLNLCSNFRGKWFTAFWALHTVFMRNSAGHPNHVSYTGWCCSQACWRLVSSVSLFSLLDKMKNSVLGYNVVKYVESQQTFRRNILPQLSG
jgi:hypothetical protein